MDPLWLLKCPKYNNICLFHDVVHVYEKLTVLILIIVVQKYNNIQTKLSPKTDKLCEEMFLPQNFCVKFIQNVHWTLKHIYIKWLRFLLTTVYWFRVTGIHLRLRATEHVLFQPCVLVSGWTELWGTFVFVW